MSEISRVSKPAERQIPESEGPDRADGWLYFAYGSNLDPDDWSAFCRSIGADPGVLRPIGPATLSDEMLVFDYRSIRRQCGALNIRSAPGRSVDGFLFAVSPEGWAILDHKEGHPHRYRRELVAVLGVDGRSVRAQTYRVSPEHRRGFTPPSPDYLAICRAGRRHFGLSGIALERAAAGGESEP